MMIDSQPRVASTFLSAEWRKLAMANYAVDQAVLEKWLPARTILDLWQGRALVSLVGFMFLNTRVKGFRIPFHSNFEEVNLRFYVRYKDQSEWKRGTVFISELVPKPAITLVANTFYGEHYRTLPMRNRWHENRDSLSVEYGWKTGNWNSFKVIASKVSANMAAGSEEEFITEHYWGYTKLSDQKTSEYGVEHPRWEVYRTKEYKIDVNFEKLYGPEFAFLTSQMPQSVLLAEGSAVLVKSGRKV